MRSIRHILVAALVLIMHQSALADAPLPAAGTRQFSCSLNGQWCAESATQREGVRVFKRTAGKDALVWSAPTKVYGGATVTNDGACVVVVSVSNLLALNATPSDPAFTIVCKDGASNVLSIGKFIADFHALPHTVSHLRWAETYGLDQQDHLSVRTVEGRSFVIDPHNGQLISGSWVH